MARLPAVCDTCGTVWTPRAIEVGVGASVHVAGTTVSPCPRCGGTGRIPDGTWLSTASGLVRSVTRAQPSRHELRQVLEFLRYVQQHEPDTTVDELAEKARRKNRPEWLLNGIEEWKRNPIAGSKNAGQLIAMLMGVLLVLLGMRELGGGDTDGSGDGDKVIVNVDVDVDVDATSDIDHETLVKQVLERMAESDVMGLERRGETDEAARETDDEDAG